MAILLFRLFQNIFGKDCSSTNSVRKNLSVWWSALLCGRGLCRPLFPPSPIQITTLRRLRVGPGQRGRAWYTLAWLIYLCGSVLAHSRTEIQRQPPRRSQREAAELLRDTGVPVRPLRSDGGIQGCQNWSHQQCQFSSPHSTRGVSERFPFTAEVQSTPNTVVSCHCWETRWIFHSTMVVAGAACLPACTQILAPWMWGSLNSLWMGCKRPGLSVGSTSQRESKPSSEKRLALQSRKERELLHIRCVRATAAAVEEKPLTLAQQPYGCEIKRWEQNPTRCRIWCNAIPADGETGGKQGVHAVTHIHTHT